MEERMNDLESLTELDLDRVSGGVEGPVCTPDNPTGQRPTQYFERSHAGPSVSERVIQSTDRAMAPWKAFNGIFGGFAGARPTPPTPPRPTYQ